jgi:alpha-beta hydrolase superfamily lysophospholipase
LTHKDGDFAGAGGCRIYWQAWLPEDASRGALLVVHGYGEHGGRYRTLVDYFVPRGWAVYALDHRGHGRSQGPRGHVRRFAEYVSDLHAFRIRVADDMKEKPIVLVGHSMGGLIAIHYAAEHADGLSGLVLSSPALGLVDGPGAFRVGLARLLSVVLPRASFRGNVDPAVLSRDGAVGRAYAADPLVHGIATARFFVAFQSAIEEAHELASEVRMPVLVLLSGADRLVDAKAAEAFTARIPDECRELIVYPELYHELFNETEKEKVFADLERWLGRCLDHS